VASTDPPESEPQKFAMLVVQPLFNQVEAK